MSNSANTLQWETADSKRAEIRGFFSPPGGHRASLYLYLITAQSASAAPDNLHSGSTLRS